MRTIFCGVVELEQFQNIFKLSLEKLVVLYDVKNS